MYLRHYRPGTLRQLARVLGGFAMPAIEDLADGRQRVEAIRALGVFDPLIYVREVYHPILVALGVKRSDLARYG